MKRLLLSLLVIPSLVSAKSIAWMPNNSGGKIVITDDVCKGPGGKIYPNMFRIYTYSSSGETSDGCFEFEGDTVHVFWPDSKQEMRYPIESFTVFQGVK